eukprot:TRINITY_DN7600_c0_g1_i2.p2 TRINITY_DN7600_c0_g1~~TRINITY_DN7600_c0_g1_i2.p2  ORF type:complete len:161 (-),score=29.67 TRINITY_DN7600_c0_g1_i2:391-873(-)
MKGIAITGLCMMMCCHRGLFGYGQLPPFCLHGHSSSNAYGSHRRQWAEAMAAQGSGGAYEISQRMTALIGWSGTADFQDQWVYGGVAERYALDPEMAQKLRKNNPEAFQNILKRMLEAAGRGFWSPDDSVLEAIREQYADIEDQIELGSGKFLEKIPERR